MFDVKYDSYETVRKIRAKALENLANGVVLTEWNSEGSSFKGVVNYDTKELLLATERFLDEYNGNLVTETVPNFLSFQ
jgi:hypothetical protein